MIIRIYTGSDGQAHFEELEFPALEVERMAIKQGGDLVFRRSEAGGVTDWHHPSRRQYLFVLAGSMEVSIGDGSSRRFQPGDVLLAEDMTGQGHVTRIIDGPNVTVSVPLPE